MYKCHIPSIQYIYRGLTACGLLCFDVCEALLLSAMELALCDFSCRISRDKARRIKVR
jgi:hypothetical protein